MALRASRSHTAARLQWHCCKALRALRCVGTAECSNTNTKLQHCANTTVSVLVTCCILQSVMAALPKVNVGLHDQIVLHAVQCSAQRMRIASDVWNCPGPSFLHRFVRPCCAFCCLQYVVETRFVGERELGTSHAEIVDVKERIVEVAQPGPTCPANTGEPCITGKHWHRRAPKAEHGLSCCIGDPCRL
jgi:hypothetical protein